MFLIGFFGGDTESREDGSVCGGVGGFSVLILVVEVYV